MATLETGLFSKFTNILSEKDLWRRRKGYYRCMWKKYIKKALDGTKAADVYT